MLKIEFTNAQVKDEGYGLSVNGKELDEIISTALGTRVGNKYGYNSGLPKFESSCCNVYVVIDPQPVVATITDDEGSWHSVEEMEEDVLEQYQKKAEQEKG